MVSPGVAASLSASVASAPVSRPSTLSAVWAYPRARPTRTGAQFRPRPYALPGGRESGPTMAAPPRAPYLRHTLREHRITVDGLLCRHFLLQYVPVLDQLVIL